MTKNMIFMIKAMFVKTKVHALNTIKAQDSINGKNGITPRRDNISDARSARPLRFALRQLVAVAALLIGFALPVVAEDYVFMYDGGYLAVKNGNVSYETNFSPSCVWTCVSSTSDLTPVELSGTTSYYLYTVENGNRYWMVGSTNNGTAIDVTTTAPGTTGWRGYSNRVRWQVPGNSTSYYVYYRNSQWRTSSSKNGNNGYDSYRATSYSVKTTPVVAVTTVTAPTIGPATSIELHLNDSQEFTALASATTTPGYTSYEFKVGSTNYSYYYFNNTRYDSESAMKSSAAWASASVAPNITYTWTLLDGGNPINNNNDGHVRFTNGNNTGTPVSVEYFEPYNAQKTITVRVVATASGETSDPSDKNITLLATPHYYTIYAYAQPSTDGKVYVGATDGTPTSSDVTVSGSIYGNTFQPYIKATANTNYEFKYWSTTPDGNSISTDATYRPTLTVSGEDQQHPTVFNYYAIFEEKPLFYFSASAVAIPNGAGTTTVDPATTSARGEHWNSTSATTTSIKFTATPDASHFLRGWSETADGPIVSTDNPYYPTLTSNSKNSASPTSKTYYARFTSYPNSISASKNAIEFCRDGIDISETFTYSLTTQDGTDAYDNVNVTSNNSSVATVSKTGTTITVTAKGQGTATITLQARKSDNSDITGVSKEVNVTVKKQVAQPVVSFTSGENTGTVNITCADDDNNTTYYYTVFNDLNNPTYPSSDNSSRLQYDKNNKPTVTDGQYVIAIAEKTGNWCPSDFSDAKQWSKCSAPKPVISNTASGNTAHVSISYTPDPTLKAPVEIYYTTNNTEPTKTNGTLYTGTFDLTKGSTTVTIRARAFSGECQETDADNYTVIFNGTTSGGQVILNDLEDHRWAYYSDNNSPIHSLKPADITIIYSGYGENTMTSTDTNQKPANSAFDQDVDDNDVQVNLNESGNKFIYYKTLENDNPEGSNSNNSYTYTTIPNPFQVRPTYGTDNNRWRGFYAWRVYSLSDGLSIKVGNTTYDSDDISEGIIIYAEQEIKFITDSPTGNEVVFEALWAKAYLNSDTHFDNDNANYRNAYERNFKKVTSLDTYNYPVTISSINPDGSGTVGTVSRTSAYTCSNDVKLENMTLGIGNTIAANSYNLAIGRGVTNGNGNVATTVYGDNSASTVNTKFTLRVESGKYSSDFYMFYGSNNSTASIATLILGSDYDRANNDNSKLIISGEVDMGGNGYYCSNANSRINTYILSGTIGAGADDKEVYMGFVNSGRACNTVRKLEIFGGVLQNGIAGGIEGGSVSTTNPNMTMRIRGGTINRRFYGAGTYSPAYGDKKIIVTGGTITTWISGGAYGKNNEQGNTQGDIYLYFGGNANQTNTDGIFGAGYGNYAYSNGTTKYTVSKSSVVFADEATTAGSVYGGGNNGFATGDIKVYLAGGTVSGNVFGGANKAPSQGNVTVTVTKGTVLGGVYGGSNTSGNISKQITVDIYGTDPQPSSGYAIGEVYGGGNQAAYTGTPKVTVYCGDNISIRELYGGGKGSSASITGSTDVTISGGNRIGYVYGGGNQASVSVNTSVTIHGGTIEHVFGGNNNSGTISGTLTVNVERGNDDCLLKIGELYGGGNHAASKAGTITIGCTGALTGAHSNLSETNRIGYELEGIGDVYGGANEANITSGNIQLDIKSGIISRVFGGNNTSGTISGTIAVNINKTGNCDWYVGNVFGGGNHAAYSGSPTVTVTNGIVSKNVYGGGNEAGVAGSTVKINGGGVGVGIYGGCNTSGEVTGAIAVNINGGQLGTATSPLYGIFGGGYGSGTSTKGNVTVTIGDKNGTKTPEIYGDIYGGSALGSVNDAEADITKIDFLNGSLKKATVNNVKTGGNIFGGGLGDANDSSKGWVNGTVQINIGANDQTDANCKSDLSEASIYGCNNTNGSPQANVTVNVYRTGHTAKNKVDYKGDDATYAIDQVFGGGKNADYLPQNGNSSSQKKATVYIFTCNNTIRRVFGGGDAAAATGVVTTITGGRFDYIFGGGNGEVIAANIGAGGTNLTVNSGIINHLFGGSNERGTINGSMGVAIYNTGCEEDIKEFFAGGNLAVIGSPDDVTPITLSTTIGCDTKFGAVYGGSNLADIYGNVELTINGGTIDKVYAGSKGRAADNSNPQNPIAAKAANIYGNTTLNIYAGAIGSAFGGSNINGNISGTITVNMDWSQSNCSDPSITNVFGASDLATYTPTYAVSEGQSRISPVVNIKHGTVSGSVFGGGNGDANDETKGVVTSNPKVTIGDAVAGHYAVVTGNVYGGGNNAAVTGNTTVTYNDNNANSTVAKLFGGGNAAAVSGTTAVTLTNGKVTGGVYGGCNASGSVGAVTVDLNGGQVGATGNGNAADVYGGGFGENTTTTDNITVTLGNTTVYGDIYGGSALGQVNASTSNTTTVTLTSATLHGSVFGGGKGDNSTTAISNGNAIVNISVHDTNLTGIYGGANINGLVKGDIAVNINANVGSSTATLDIFGGGYGAATNTNGNVTVTIGDLAGTKTPIIYGDIYGGSALGNVNDAASDLTKIDFLNGTLKRREVSTGVYKGGNIYGGGLGDKASLATEQDPDHSNVAAKVNGKVQVNIGSNEQDATKCKIDLREASIFGCNNTNGSPQADVEVHIYKTAHNYSDYSEGNNYTASNGTHPNYAIDQVFGGGNQADYLPENGLSSSEKKATVHVYTCDNTIRRVFGGGNAAASTGVATIIEGGRFYQIFGGGNGEVSAANIGDGGASMTVSGGIISQLFGGSNSQGSITGPLSVDISNSGCEEQISEFFGGGNRAEITGSITTNIRCSNPPVSIDNLYGGSNLANIGGNVTLNVYGGDFINVYGGSKGVADDPNTTNVDESVSANIGGNVTLNLYGGEMENAYGGSNINGNIGGIITVNMLDFKTTSCALSVNNIYGASNLAAYTPNDNSNGVKPVSPIVNIINGSVTKKSDDTGGNVFGGGQGASAIVTANPKVNFGYDASTMSSYLPTSGSTLTGYTMPGTSTFTAIVAGDIFGGGDKAEVTGNTTVILTAGTVTNAYGGGNRASINGNTQVNLQGATVNNVFGGGNNVSNLNDKSAATQTAVNMTAGTVKDGIYGGSNELGDISSSATVNITGGTIGAAAQGTQGQPEYIAEHRVDVFGSGKGQNTKTNLATVNIGTESGTGYTGNATIYGDVYGGSELGQAGTTIVNLNKATTLKGDVFGGGKGDNNNSIAATITTKATVNQNNLNLYTGKNIYGGCNEKGTAAATEVNLLGGTTNDAFGGGLGQNTSVSTGNAVVNVGSISGISTNNAEVHDVYGGSAQGSVTSTIVNLWAGTVTGNVYGGGLGTTLIAAAVNGNTRVNVNGDDDHTNGPGTCKIYGSVFGANNTNGSPTGTVSVYVYSTAPRTGQTYDLTAVYGGGQDAATSTATNVYIIGGNTADVFGGGLGNTASVTGATVSMTGGTAGNVYGGGSAADVNGNTTVTISGGSVSTDVFGGGYGQTTTVTGNVVVNIGQSGQTTGGATIGHNVYGGSAKGIVNAQEGSPNTYTTGATTKVNLYKGTVTGSVYGGGLGDNTPNAEIAADVYGPVTVTVYGGNAANVFGANNLYGAPQNSVKVDIKGSDPIESPATYAIGNVYGGGNQADYTYTGSTLIVEVSGGIINNVFGGGLSADVTGSIEVDIKGGQVVNDVYGGGALANTNIGNVSSGYGTGSETISRTDTYTTTVNLTGGTIGNAYGGGLGNFTTPAYVYGDVTVTLGKDDYSIGTAFTHETITPQTGKTVTKTGRLFGANNINGTPKGNITVTVWRTTIFDTDGNIKAKPTRSDDPSVPSIYELAAVYGGGNQANYVPISGKNTIVNIHGCDYSSIEAVYGGGNSASVPATDVNIFGSYEIGFVFGGGNGSEMIKDSNDQWQESPGADVIGLAKVTLKGGEIHDVFGGSNTKGNCGSTSIDDSNSQDGECPLHIINMYGAGKSADVNTDVVMTISGCTTNDGVKNVYAGSYDAKIGGKITLNVRGGILENVFGGNNMGGSISGPIVVNVEETDDCKPIIINNLYGGGNKAAYPGASAVNPVSSITVNVKSCTRIDNLYGGSLDADVDCSTQVNINMVKGKWANIENAILDNYTNIPNIVAGSNGHKKVEDKIGTIGNVYGGGNKGNVLGDAVVNIGTMTVIEFDTVFETIPDYLAPIAITNGDKQEYKVLGARITGNVYGGGNQADVTGNTYVNICAVKENDSYTSVDLSVVRNNNNDNVAEGVKILGSVYGGGNMGSVGTFTVNGAGTDDNIMDGKPVSCANNTGTSNVVVLGYAEIGPDNMKMITESGMPDDAGHVFGAGRGTVHFSDIQNKYTNAQLTALTDQQKLDELAKIAYVYNTEVIIGSYAFVKGSVYGGSENGHVLHDTHVTIKDDCQIGVGDGINRRYVAEEWTQGHLIAQDQSENTLASTYSASLPECASWTYDASNPKPYDIYDYQTGTSKPEAATDGHTFYGNVFGGGSGYYPYASNPDYDDIDDYGYANGLWLRSAGVVEGNTVVDITGGHILTSVYGGNEQTDVLGSTTINMSDGTVGVPRTLAQMQAHPVTCYVFGGGKGDQRKNFNKWTNVGSANVNITGTARIYGSVFGGGEDGHVIGDAVTNIGSSQANADNSHILIGTTGTSAVDGNIFGGGRGFSGTALTAGVVQGNITVNIYGGTMLGSVFGGGRLASVGTNLVYPEAAVTEDSNGNVTAITNAAGNPLYGTLLDGTDHGNIYVNIYGGTIGATDNNGSLVASAYSIGDVFAGSKGNLIDPELGLANNTTLNISGGTINHNVYGGGEIASVGKITNFKQRDSKDNNKYIYRHDFDPKANDGALYSFGLSWPYEFTYPTATNSQGKLASGLATVNITGTTTRIAGDVFGGSKGMVDVGENDITRQRFKEALYANVLATDVTIHLSATANSTDDNASCIVGYVYGGGEDGHILDNTYVTISNGLIGGSVYGGGKGLGQYTTTILDPDNGNEKSQAIYSWTAGKVYGNTNVTMTDGHVMHNVYGGGYNGSVGKGNYAGGADDYYPNGYGELPLNDAANLWTITEGLHDFAWHFMNSGKTYVKVIGGTIGTESNAESDGFPYGNVFGGSRGKAAKAISGWLSPRYRYIPEFYLGYSNDTEVEIGSDGSSNGPRIYGSVYGSGQDGHVRRDTKVTVYGGVIGIPYSGTPDLTSAQWLHRGNVYGAGSGLGLDATNVQNYSSGSVTCATQVIIEGGTIYQNVYGGGALASVGPPKVNQTYDESNKPGGDTKSYSYSKVTVNGGTIGTDNGYGAGYGGNVYGASRGSMPLGLNIADTRFATDLWTDVNISGGTVSGNVFGGGEAGEVKDGVTVNIVGGEIKNDVYGGGALANTNTGNWGTDNFKTEGGFLATNNGKTTTRYNTKVSLLGGLVGGDVYGGGLGRLASTGVTAVEAMVYGDVFVNLNGFDVRDFGGSTASVPAVLLAKAPSPLTQNGKEHMIPNNQKGAVVNRLFGANNLNGTPAGHIKVHVFATQNENKPDINTKESKQMVQGEEGHENETLQEFLERLESNYSGNAQILAAIDAAETANSDYLTALGSYNAAIAEGSTATTEQIENLFEVLQTAQTAASEAIAAIYDLIAGVYDVQEVYGGGNLAAYVYGNGATLESPSDSDTDDVKSQKNAQIAAARTEVIIDGCDFTSIKTVYGGGNAASVPGTYVLVNGSYEINELFGGGNGNDNYSLNGVWYENPGANVGYENYTHVIKSTEQGYNSSTHGSGTELDPYKAIDNDNASTKEDRITNYAYGSGIATTEVRGGTIHTVFGGSDKKGNIRNSAISVYTESNDDCPIIINETYGGGKDAPMDAETEFNIECITEVPIIYGGANNADSYSDITLNITNGHIGSVYGGNNIGGALYGSIIINIEEKGCTPIVIDSLFGGGNLAPYSIYGYEKELNNGVYVFKHDDNGKLIPLESEPNYGNDPATSNHPRINIISATHISNVYGGGYKAKLVGSPVINVNMQEGKMEVYKKNIGGNDVFVDNNYDESAAENDTYTPVPALTETYEEEGVEKTKYFTQLNLGNIDNIYGGGFEADVAGDTHIEIGTGEWITGWNNDEAVYAATKNTDDDTKDRHDAVIIGNVFGGGDNADVTGNTNITVGNILISSSQQNLKIMHNIYGGGNMGSVGTITEQTIHSSTDDGFGLSWPYEFKYKDGTGKTTVNINGGRIGLSGKDSFGNLKKDDNGNLVYKADADGYLLGADGERIQLNNNYVTATDITTETTYNQVKDQLQTINKREDNGDVYGGSKGHAGGLKGEIAPDRYKEALIANVRETEVNINLPTPTDADIDILVSYDWEDEDNEDQMKYALNLHGDLYGIAGSVYGGGEDGHVYDGTNVNINGGYIGHSVYGGGKGKGTYTTTLKSIGGSHETYQTLAPSIIAGKVFGNTNVTMTNGYVMRNIFGGGNLGSIGKGNYASGADDYYTNGYGEKISGNLWTTQAGTGATATLDNAWHFLNSGIANVQVTGGKVGFLISDNTNIVYTEHTPDEKRTHGYIVNAYAQNYTILPKKISFKDDLPTGNVFGGSRGTSAPDVGSLSPRYEYVPDFYLGYVNETNVVIGSTGTGPTLLGSVYGGGQDGHVRRDAVVTINNGEIGIAYNETNRTHVGTLANNATTEQQADHSDLTNVQWLHRGNIYGAGSGIGKYKYDGNNDGDYNDEIQISSTKTIGETGYGSSAGSVSRFTTVNVGSGINGTTGHIIYRNVYGGGSLSSIGPAKIFQTYDPYLPSDQSHLQEYGKQTLNQVNIEGTVGHEASYEAAGYGGDVNGGSRGDATLDANTFATSYFTEVNIKQGANVIANVFGGGEAGLVKNDSYVNMANGIAITGATVGHNLFGGGDQADVQGNTYVAIGGGWIKKNVYGGGNLGSVGTIDATKTVVHNTSKESGMGKGALYDFGLSWPVKLEYVNGTGTTNVTVTGGRIGISGKDYMGYDNSLTDEQKYDLREDNGDIYGGSRGEPAERYTEAYNANVNTTNVTIEYPNSLVYEFGTISSLLNVNDDKVTIKDNEPGIHGSVYGGGENGHVIGNTNLTLNNGLIGHGMYGGGKGKDTYRGSLKDYKAYKINGQDVTYDTDVASITAGKVYGNTNVTMNGGYVLRNIYGGGNLASVGKGNYSGGTDDYSLEGYGELPPMDGSAEGSLWTNTDFMNSGICYVTINGGTIGYFDANSNLNAFTKDDLPTGNVFGSCRGMAAPNYNDISPRYLYFPEFFYGYVNQTEVTIGNGTGNGPTILGSVYGGGQDGHVRRDSKVTVNNGNIGLDYSTFSSAISGTDIKDTQFKDRGNIYGAGSGIGKFKFDTRQADPENQGKTIIESGYNYSSGSVTGTTTVTINGGTIYQSVYGGGALASVGPPNIGVDHGLGFDEFKTTDDYSRPAGFEQYNAHLSKSSNNIIIDGGTIGSQAGHTAGYGGNVFGASRGNISNMNLGPTWFLHATTIWTNVKARTGHIFGNVFGGGENGEVKRDTYVEIGGIPVRPAQPNHAPANNNNQEPDSSPAPQRQDQENSQPQNSVNGVTQGNVATESLQNRTINTNRAGQ